MIRTRPSTKIRVQHGLTPKHEHDVNIESSRQTAFVLSNPPLAALHNMTEWKYQIRRCLRSRVTHRRRSKTFLRASRPPHGINDILGRPNTNSNATFGVSRLNNTVAGAGMYFTPQTRFPKLAELPGRPPIYWPGVLPGTWRPQGTWSCLKKREKIFRNILLLTYEIIGLSYNHCSIYIYIYI